MISRRLADNSKFDQYSTGANTSKLDTLQSEFRAVGGKWLTFIILAKNTFTLGRTNYQRQYEPILCGLKDGTQHF